MIRFDDTIHLLPILFAGALLVAGCSAIYITQDDLDELRYGMTEQEVVDELGHPTRVNRSAGENWHRAQFVYRQGGLMPTVYVYFDNGKLTSLQY